MKTENNSKHIKTIAIISMVVTAIVAIIALILRSKDSRFADLEDLLDDDFFDDDLVGLTEDEEEEGVVTGTNNYKSLENATEEYKDYCKLRNIHCKCTQCPEKYNKCDHCKNCKGVTDVVSEHEDCEAAGYLISNTNAN